MARTNVPVNNLVADGQLTLPSTVALDPTNGHIVTPGGSQRFNRVFLQVKNTTASTKTITIKAGALYHSSTPGPGVEAVKGDLVFSFATTVERTLGPFTSSRFVQTDGSIWVDVEAATTGTIIAYYFPTAP